MTSVTQKDAGGQSLAERMRAKYGPDYYTRRARKGGAGLIAKRGREHMARIGRKGGLTTAVIYDRDDIGDRISAGHARAKAQRAKTAEGSAA